MTIAKPIKPDLVIGHSAFRFSLQLLEYGFGAMCLENTLTGTGLTFSLTPEELEKLRDYLKEEHEHD